MFFSVEGELTLMARIRHLVLRQDLELGLVAQPERASARSSCREPGAFALRRTHKSDIDKVLAAVMTMTVLVGSLLVGGGCLAGDPQPLQPIVPVPDKEFQQEYRHGFVNWDQAVGYGRVALAVDVEGSLWAAGPWGVSRLAGDRWESPTGDALDGPAFGLASDGETVWVAGWDALYRIDQGRLSQTGLAEKPLGLVRATGNRRFAGGPDGLWERAGDQAWKPVPGHYSHSLNDVASESDRLWIASQRGLFLVRGEAVQRIFSPDEIASGDVRSLAVASDGRLWIGSSGGIDVVEQGQRVAHFGGDEGLPSTDVRRLRFDPQGVLWVATSQGVARWDGQRWTWRHSLRWLPSDEVRDVAHAPDGTAFIATTAGLAIWKRRPMTLADKADHYQQIVRARHVRPPGLVERCILKQPGDLSSFAPTDTDNDGLFTGLYVAAEAFRYAVTGDEDAARNARESYRAMEYLQTVTDTPGFVARTVIPSDWSDMADRNRTYTPQQIAVERVEDPRFKRVENRWRKSRDGKWLWKGDTSSDEITGHYFAYALYFDLVADDAERHRVAEHVRKITDYIIDGGYELRDIDGQHTLWGVWSPEKLWGDPDWQPEQSCNAVEILSYLAIAHHITGDDKYLKELARLFDDERYKELILQPKLSAPSEFTYIDDELLNYCYRGLLAYDRDPRRLPVYLASLRNWFQFVEQDHSPMYSFVFGGIMGGRFGAEGCVEYLRDSPLDMVEWTIDNQGREDLRIVRRPVIEDWQTSRLLPPSERAVAKWDANPYRAVGGSDGRDECSSVHWLLPYWMGRYYGIIQ